MCSVYVTISFRKLNAYRVEAFNVKAIIRPGEVFKKEIDVITEKTGRERLSNFIIGTLIPNTAASKTTKSGQASIKTGNETNDVNRPGLRTRH